MRWVPLALGLSATRSEEEEQCLALLVSEGLGERWAECRVPLLRSFFAQALPHPYSAASDCDFWAHIGVRDRTVEARLSWHNASGFRVADPFQPPVGPNGTLAYVGAHRGAEDAHAFGALFRRVHLFEPLPGHFADLLHAVARRPRWLHDAEWTVHNYGWGAASRVAQIVPQEEGSSLYSVFAAAVPAVEVVVKRSRDVLEELGLARIDLLHVNCEGCEFELFDGLGDALRRVGHIQIGTHLVPPPQFSGDPGEQVQYSINRYCKMHERLSRTHRLVKGVPWVWERWAPRA
jgi:FkbM family methyltransferase